MTEVLAQPFILMCVIAIGAFSLVLATVSIADALGHKSLDN